MSPRTAYWIADILSDDDARAFIFGRGSQLDFPFPVAVKTGTSQAYHDNWTVGFSQHVTVGVWVGNFDRTPLVGSSGVTGAGPLFHAVMLAAEARAAGTSSADGALAARPSDLVETPICGLSGMRAQDACPIKRREWLPRDAPQAGADALPCSWHHAIERGVVTVWPERYRAWADASGVRSALDRRSAAQPAFVSGAVDPRREAASDGDRPARHEPSRRHRLSHRPDTARGVPGCPASSHRRRKCATVVDGKRTRRGIGDWRCGAALDARARCAACGRARR